MERRKKVNHGIGADFSRTCEGCGCITVETVAGLPPLFRCNAPGQRRGYTVSAAGRFLPYEDRNHREWDTDKPRQQAFSGIFPGR